jgi:hypothetical protein
MSTIYSEERPFTLYPLFLIGLALTFAIIAASMIIPAKKLQKEYPNQLSGTVVKCEQSDVYLSADDNRAAVYNHTLTIDYTDPYGNARSTKIVAVKSAYPEGASVEIACSRDGQRAVLAAGTRIPPTSILIAGLAVLTLILLPVTVIYAKKNTGF